MVYIDAQTKPRPRRNRRQMSDESPVSISIAPTIRQPCAVAPTFSLPNLHGNGPSPAVSKNAFCPALPCSNTPTMPNPAAGAPTRHIDASSAFVAFGRDRTRPSTSCHKRTSQYPVMREKKFSGNHDNLGHNATFDTLSIPFPPPPSSPAAHTTGRVAHMRPGNPHAAALSTHFGMPAAAQPVGSRPSRGI